MCQDKIQEGVFSPIFYFLIFDDLAAILMRKLVILAIFGAILNFKRQFLKNRLTTFSLIWLGDAYNGA